MIHHTAVVEPGASIGEDTNIWHFAHVRDGAVIGARCNLGKDVFVDCNVTVGDECKIQNGVCLYEGLAVENNVFLGPHVTFTNDMYPRALGRDTDWELVHTRVLEGASIGANSTIVCGVTVGRYAMVGAGSVVTKDVPDYALVIGNPARVRGRVDRSGRPVKSAPGAQPLVSLTRGSEESEKPI